MCIMGGQNAIVGQNDTPTDWQIGCTASRHHSVFKFSLEPKFQGCT